jgi:hypothetical protein
MERWWKESAKRFLKYWVSLFHCHLYNVDFIYRGADKSLARPGRKQATATEDFDFHISYL